MPKAEKTDIDVGKRGRSLDSSLEELWRWETIVASEYVYRGTLQKGLVGRQIPQNYGVTTAKVCQMVDIAVD